jgi:hypothetical protein
MTVVLCNRKFDYDQVVVDGVTFKNMCSDVYLAKLVNFEGYIYIEGADASLDGMLYPKATAIFNRANAITINSTCKNIIPYDGGDGLESIAKFVNEREGDIYNICIFPQCQVSDIAEHIPVDKDYNIAGKDYKIRFVKNTDDKVDGVLRVVSSTWNVTAAKGGAVVAVNGKNASFDQIINIANNFSGINYVNWETNTKGHLEVALNRLVSSIKSGATCTFI